MTLAKYDRKFEKLCRYTPKLVNTKEVRAWRFENGLNKLLYDVVAAQHLPSYAIVLQQAQKLEEGHAMRKTML